MNRHVNLTERICTPKGLRYGRLEPGYVTVVVRQERHPEGTYYLERYEDGRGSGVRSRRELENPNRRFRDGQPERDEVPVRADRWRRRNCPGSGHRRRSSASE